MKKICQNCGSIARPKKVTRGSFIIEIILWLTFIIPGILYTLWRMTTTTRVCRRCGAPNLIPLNSPVGRKLQNQYLS